MDQEVRHKRYHSVNMSLANNSSLLVRLTVSKPITPVYW